MKDPQIIWPSEQPQREILVNRHPDDLPGRFANLFSITFNGDDFTLDFSTQVPRQDGKLEQNLSARIFMTQKGLAALANSIQQIVQQIQNNLTLPPPSK